MYSATGQHFLETDPTREENLPILINDAGLLYRRYFNRQVKKLGLTAAQWEVLSYIYRRQGLTQTELADLLATGKSPLGKKLDSLEAKGMVERKSDENDRRVKRIYMTHKLDSLEDELREVVDNMVLLAAEGISNPDLDQIRAWLRIMISNLTNALSDDPKKADLP
ncbi:MAG: MarR family transcriptional regulator [Gammaproteobacteria bacterium]|nr:MarR family transcriptional regulator [Gammaproteobacteria bacterium]